MKKLALFVLLLLVSSSAFAFIDVGLIKSQKTLGYYLMPNTATQALSSGLVYNLKNNDGSETEILYTGFNSAYLLTRNVTQLNAHKKYKIGSFGPLNLEGVIGFGLMYSPATGGGLTFDIGGIPSVYVMDSLAVAVPLYAYVFNDGLMFNVNPSVYVKPDFLAGCEIFGGFRIDARVVGSLSQIESTGAGSINTYLTIGARKEI